MSDQKSSTGVQVLRVEDIDDELFAEIMNAQYGVASGGKSQAPVVRDQRDEHIEKLEDLLYDIALMAESHKASKLYVEDENVALVNIRNMAAFSIGLADVLRERGTLMAPAPVRAAP